MTSVIWWEKYQGKLLRYRDVCFRTLGTRYNDRVTNKFCVIYAAKINKSLSINNVERFCNFICLLFPAVDIRFKISKHKKVPYVFVQINPKDLAYKQLLAILTLFRYVDEFADVVNKWAAKYEESNKLEQHFKNLLIVHMNYVKNALYAGLGHAISSNTLESKIISLEQFSKKFENKNEYFVTNFFENV